MPRAAEHHHSLAALTLAIDDDDFIVVLVLVARPAARTSPERDAAEFDQPETLLLGPVLELVTRVPATDDRRNPDGNADTREKQREPYRIGQKWWHDCDGLPGCLRFLPGNPGTSSGPTPSLCKQT